MNSGESRYTDNDKLALAAVQQRRKARARRKGMCVGEILVDDDFRG